MQEPEELLEELLEKGLVCPEDKVDPVKQSVDELKKMILGDDLRDQDKRYRAWTEEISFERLAQLSFVQARDVIHHISLAKRIKLLKELDYHRVFLYEATKGYTDQGFGRSMSPKEFQRIMGKIKHLEVLTLWLYGIE